MGQEVIADILRDHINKLAVEGKRIDGRAFDEARPVEIATGMLTSAEGSARAKLGLTEVYTGIKMALGKPFPDTPDRGVMTTGAEFNPIADPYFESGPPQQPAIEVARVVDRGIRESGMIDISSLCVEPEESVWIAFIDMHIINNEGNLIDACSLAATAALRTTIVPAEREGLGDNYPLPVTCTPVASTMVKVGGKLMLDPYTDEEKVATARLTMTFDDSNALRAMQKGFNGAFTLDEIEQAKQMALKNSQALRPKVLG